MHWKNKNMMQYIFCELISILFWTIKNRDDLVFDTILSLYTQYIFYNLNIQNSIKIKIQNKGGIYSI